MMGMETARQLYALLLLSILYRHRPDVKYLSREFRHGQQKVDIFSSYFLQIILFFPVSRTDIPQIGMKAREKQVF